MTDPIKDAAAELRRQIEEKVELLKASPEMIEVTTLLRGLNGLEDILHESRTDLPEFLGLTPGPSTVAKPLPSPAVRFDLFYGTTDLQAAKAYLKQRSDARPFDEIVTVIKSGGAKVESEDRLRTGLSRSTLDLVKIGDRYGHIDNYPEEKARRLKKLRKSPSDGKKDERTGS